MTRKSVERLEVNDSVMQTETAKESVRQGMGAAAIIAELNSIPFEPIKPDVLLDGRTPEELRDAGRPAIYIRNREISLASRGGDFKAISDNALESNASEFYRWLGKKSSDFISGLEELLVVDNGEITTEYRGTCHWNYRPQFDGKKKDSVTYTILERIYSVESTYRGNISSGDVRRVFENQYLLAVGHSMTDQQTLFEDVEHERGIRETIMITTLSQIANDLRLDDDGWDY